MLSIITWSWGSKYGSDYVAKLKDGVARHLREPHRFILVSEWVHDIHGVECIPIPDMDLTRVPGCFARLRMFDPQWQRQHGIEGRIVNLDLDMVITGELDPLFYRPEPFVILTGANASNPCKVNGSVFMLRAGAHADAWSDFSLEKAKKIPFHEFPDDQGWIDHKIPNAAGWKVGAPSGIYGFKKPGWPDKSLDLPTGARIVSFFGKRDPSQYTSLPWVREHWV